MLVMTAIPGQTGYLATRNVPKPTRRKAAVQAPVKATKKNKRVTGQNKARYYELQNGQPQFSGGPHDKKVLNWGERDEKDTRKWRNRRARNDKQHGWLRPARDSIRKI